MPNLSAVYLSNYLMKRGLEVDYINLFQHEKATLARMLQEDPVCVAITTTFYVVNLPVTEIVEFVRQYNKTVPIIVGGVLVSNHQNAFGEEEFLGALRDMGGDIFVLESQGEATLGRLIEQLKAGGDLAEVPNIVYQKDGKQYMTPAVKENNPLDENAIDWRLFRHKNLGPTIQTRTARSCAFECAFCGYPQRGGALTLASLDTVANELEAMRSLGNVKNVVFIDDTFNVPKARFKDFCRMLIERDFQFNWFSYYRCDHGDEEAIELMRKSGCKGVFLGLESGSQEILVKMNKRAKVQNYEKGIKGLKENGITTFVSLITGYPGETEDTIKETLDFLVANKPDYWRTQIWYCDPLTPVYKNRREEFGIVGEGFKWRHNTMDSMTAADCIEEMFLQIDDSVSTWLPQYSFNFWILPYVLGKGVSLPALKKFMVGANKMLALEIATLDKQTKQFHQKQLLDELMHSVRPKLSLV
ncbi:MAG: radical SAM protein, partial [Cytophagales bacterium]|nr:radical SAM protein [Cytophagales bacterium]